MSEWFGEIPSPDKVDKASMDGAGGAGNYLIHVLSAKGFEWQIIESIDKYAENPWEALQNVIKLYPNEVYEFDNSHFN